MVILTGGRDNRPTVECLLCGKEERDIAFTSLPRTAPPRARVYEHLMEMHGLSDSDIRHADKRNDGAGRVISNAQQFGDFMREQGSLP